MKLYHKTSHNLLLKVKNKILNMSIEEIKKLLKNSAAVLIMENGEPAFVMMNYQQYRDMVQNGDQKEIKVTNNNDGNNGTAPKPAPRDGEMEILERINKDILALKDEIEKEEKNLYAVD